MTYYYSHSKENILKVNVLLENVYSRDTTRFLMRAILYVEKYGKMQFHYFSLKLSHVKNLYKHLRNYLYERGRKIREAK